MDFANLPLGPEYTILQMKRSNEQKSMCVCVSEREKAHIIENHRREIKKFAWIECAAFERWS